MLKIAAAVALAASSLAVSPAWAVNKCTGPGGSVVFQDAPCAAESKKSEAVKVWGGNTSYSARAVAQTKPNLQMDLGTPGARLVELYRRWADAETLALSTARIALAKPVADLQALQREAESLAIAVCFEGAKAALVKLIAKNVAVMISFMGKEEISGMVYQFVERGQLIKEFESQAKNANCPG